MKPEKWRKLEALYQAALQCDPSKRQSFLDESCANDSDLRKEIDSLLESDARAKNFLEVPAIDVQARSMVAGRSDAYIGRQLSHYRITEKIGEGGMGAVYKADDLRLERVVALKFLSPNVLDDGEAKIRFLREAKAIAALDHPNVCTIFEIGDDEADTFLAMAFVEGETVRDKIARRPLRLPEALDIALQTAQGLQAAHKKGIVHRDIKSANLMVNPQGRVKIMDFGLAQLSDRSRLTLTKTIMGTPAYMSPEQAKGLPSDHRADIWSLAIVLYEMVAGRVPFEGDVEHAVLYLVVHEVHEPLTAVRAGVPLELDRILSKALAKDPDDRYQQIDELLVDLRHVSRQLQSSAGTSATADRVTPPAGSLMTAEPDGRRLRKLIAVSAVIAIPLMLAAAGIGYIVKALRPPDTVLRLEVSVPEDPAMSSRGMAISPDGQKIAYVARNSSGQPALWIRPLVIRSLDKLEPIVVSGTRDAYSPFWSPDSSSIAFFAEGKLKRVSISDGGIRIICDAENPATGRAGAWSKKDVIIFALSFGPLRRVPARGGEPEAATSLDEGTHEFGHYEPFFLPDSDHFLYNTGVLDSGTYVGSLISKDRIRLSDSYSSFAVSDGFLLFVEQGVLKAQKLDISRFQLVGDSVRIAEGVLAASLSMNGTLAYGQVPRTQLTWFDYMGTRLKTIGPPGYYLAPAISPDETRVAVGRDGDIWIFDLARGTETRVTSHPGAERYPVWSPDSREILYDRGGSLYKRLSSGVGAEELVLSGSLASPFEWTQDGKYVTYFSSSPDTLGDLHILSMSGNRKSSVFLNTKYQEVENRLSPDGKWMAYASTESGRYEVYVQTFPVSDQKTPISTDGGLQPIWRKDQKEMFYLGPKGLMAVDIKTGTAVVEAGPPRFLFPINAPTGPVRNSYSPARDGKQFLVNSFVEDAASGVVVVVNWPALMPN